MNYIDERIKKIECELSIHTKLFVEELDNIFNNEIPEGAKKIVFWIPADGRYSVSFSYMTNDGNEVGDYINNLKKFDDYLENLIPIDDFERDDATKIHRRADMSILKWLAECVSKSKFNGINLSICMATNNACEYFDLESQKQLKDQEMWPVY